MRLAVLATCNLNQWAMDFEGNLQRILLSVRRARAAGARFRVGPELETTGYGCEDHFYEPDTFLHSWESIAAILPHTHSLLVDVGAPVLHRGVAYNCRVLLLDGDVIFVRPKLDLAGEGNYREPRWFRAWPRNRGMEDLALPKCVSDASKTKTSSVPIGPGIVQFRDGTSLACETCEELWTPNAPHIAYSLEGVDVIANGSASHHELRKRSDRIDLLTGATRRGGGAYLYANQIGCDGGRLYYDGTALVVLNGEVLAQGSQFALNTEVEVVTATIDLDDVIAFRNSIASRCVQAASIDDRDNALRERVHIASDFSLVPPDIALQTGLVPTSPLETVSVLSPQEEIARGPACWLWDYLRRSGMNGFFLPLSGGADSSSTAAIVGSMCQLLVHALRQVDDGGEGDEDAKNVLSTVRRITGTSDSTYVPRDPRELAGRILHTAYMGSVVASSSETRDRAAVLAKEIGAWHCSIVIDGVVDACLKVFSTLFGELKQPKFRVHGGTKTENLALQNIQARTRMLLAYLFAQLLLWARGKNGSLLVLGSANVDEGLRGYLTKYDCSSADVNPIGGICKADLKSFLHWCSRATPNGLGYQSLRQVVEAPPSAELEPLTASHTQTDEQDMGMTYDELTWYGRLRQLQRSGPLSMYRKLVHIWQDRGLTPLDVAAKVKFFFRMYSINRHKMTTLTPSYHAENYSPEDNRHDLRPFLYNINWVRQFRAIDKDADIRQSRPTANRA